MLKQVIDAMVDSFPEDPSQPSIVFSRLQDGSYYGSLVRYAERFGKGKQVLYNCVGADPDAVLNKLWAQLGGNDGRDGAVSSDGGQDSQQDVSASVD